MFKSFIPCASCEQNAFWDIDNSDPYKAISYDLLHSDDLGKFKRILSWVFERLEGSNLLGLLQQWYRVILASEIHSTDFLDRMDRIPPFPGLRHYRKIAQINELKDGNYFRDIMRQILPCLPGLLTNRNEPIIVAIREFAEIRTLSSLSIFDDERLHWMSCAIARYSVASAVSIAGRYLCYCNPIYFSASGKGTRLRH
jgi:hypothetical protein